MGSRSIWVIVCLLLSSTAALSDKPPATSWQVKGELSEACSCSVPCPCNFGQSPSPHHFCYALFSLDVKEGHYGDTDLSGLRLAGAGGAKGTVWYIDARANKQQTAELTAIAKTLTASSLKASLFQVTTDDGRRTTSQRSRLNA